MSRRSSPQVFAVATFGGHFEQLVQLTPAWDGVGCLFVSTRPSPSLLRTGRDMALVDDCHWGEPFRTARCAIQMVSLFVRHRPACVVTTGALPGLLAAVIGRALGARVIWIDSMANAETMSGSGKVARVFAHVWCSQWSRVAEREGARYLGSLF